MAVVTLPRLTSGGHELDLSPEAFGWLRDSNDALGNVPELRRRFDEDGYLFLPGFLDRDEVRAVRGEIVQRFADEGTLDPDYPVDECVIREGLESYFRPDISNSLTGLQNLIYSDQVMAFYSALFDEPAMHYDFTWMRAIGKGNGTFPHCDVVYMGRGAKDVRTAWVPFGDVPLEVGGLVVVEGSHRSHELADSYWTLDVDTACQNGDGNVLKARGYQQSGAVSNDITEARQRYGQRILTCPEYRMGDFLTFSVYLLHGSLDNTTRRIRISSDSRYQRASEPADERWVGEAPPAHGGLMVKDLIC